MIPVFVERRGLRVAGAVRANALIRNGTPYAVEIVSPDGRETKEIPAACFGSWRDAIVAHAGTLPDLRPIFDAYERFVEQLTTKGSSQ